MRPKAAVIGRSIALIAMIISVVPVASSATSPALLAAANTITGSTIVSAAVRLDTVATIADPRIGGSISLSGAGRVVGFVLAGEDASDIDRPVLTAGRQRRCSAGSCVDDEFVHFFNGRRPREPVTLPAGDYVLYLLADGAPVTATLALQGPAGTVDLAPDDLARGWIGESPSAIEETQTGTVFSHGRYFDIEGRGGLWSSSYRLRGRAWVDGQYGLCIQGNDLVPRTVAFAPMCPTGSGFSIGDGAITFTGFDKDMSAIALFEGGGTWGFGTWHTAAATEIERTQVVAFYLDFD